MSAKNALDTNPTVLLSDATLSALQLQQQPFGQLDEDSLCFSDETTVEQLADVKQALITGDDLLLILGESGAGKTVLLRQLGENSGLRIQCFAVKGSSRFSTLNLFAGMLEAFKRPPPEKLKDILDDLIPCLQTMVERNTLSAIVLDDAHLVTETELTQLLSGMLYINSQDETLLRVALAAPPQFEDRIPDLLPEGADLPYSSLTIEGMEPGRAADYLTFRLEQAGFADEWPFSDEEIDELVEQSSGLPGGLHAAAAHHLNEQYGPLDDIQPEALQNHETGSLLQSRLSKLAMGVLATVLIVGGLSMFMPSQPENGGDSLSSSDTSRIDLDSDASKLVLVDTEALKPAAETGNTASVFDSDNNNPDANGNITQTATPGESTPTLSEDIPSGSDNAADSTDPASDESAAISANGSIEEPSSSNASAQSASGSQRLPIPETPANTDDSPVAVIVPETGDASEQQSNEASSDDAPGAQPAIDESSADNAADEGAPASNASAQAESADADESPAGIDVDAVDVDPELAGVLESPTWILVQDRNLFTVQMIASTNRASVENFLRRNVDTLQTPNSIFTFERDGNTWYALLHGLYESLDEARAAVESMPSRALTNQPWIRSVGRVQGLLKDQ